MAESNEFTIGYFPKSMPRDPRDIDMYLEHLGVGQVIETIVKVSDDGNIAPNLAESWKIYEDGLKFEFKLFENIVFTDESKLDSEDIKFSILRHLEASSQSKGYLQNIKEIKCNGPYVIEIILKEPQVSFLKVLTRDHLGIVPKNWKFNVASKEPWTGTGPYRYVIEGKNEYFIKNQKYRKAKEIGVDRWKILKSDNVIEDSIKLEVPDYILHIPLHVKEALLKIDKFKDIQFKRPLHFMQSLAWWYPLGENYKNKDLQTNFMSILDELVLELNKKNHFELATGIVPKGIQGHIQTRIKSDHLPIRFKDKKTIRVSVYNSDFDSFFGNELYKQLEQKFNFIFEIQKVIGLTNPPEKFKPDILIAGYAGGFSDPDGFLIVLGSILGVDFKKYLEDIGTLYEQASKEQAWTERGRKFNEINSLLVSRGKVVPAWKKDLYTGKSSRIIEENAPFNYNLRLSRFKSK